MREQTRRLQRQFLVLYRVFLLRVVDLEILSADGDVTKLLGQFAALLAGISFALTVWLIVLGGPLPQEFLWTMEHFLISTTMTVVGLFSVFNWDSIFPDKQDVLVLAPLPVRPDTLFLAKFGALISAVGLSVAALNVFTGLIWPLLFAREHGGWFAILRSFFAYWDSVALAGVFVFCTVVGVQGVVSQLLPRQYFLRLSSFIQAAAFALLLGVYILEPSLETRAALAAGENQHLLQWLPSYWFLGLFQQLNGTMLPEFAPLARYAWNGLGIAIVMAIALALFSYRYTLRKIVEEPDILPSSASLRLISRIGKPLESAIFLFSLRTLLRSRQHRVILSFYLGVGLAITVTFIEVLRHATDSADAQPCTSSLMASILMMTLAVIAVRIVAGMPIAVRANWVFRITELRSVPEYIAAVERTMLLLAVVPVCAVSAIQMTYQFSFHLAMEHLVILGLLGMLLAEISLYNFQKIPFTCSYLPGKGNLQYVFWAFTLLVLPLVHAAAHFETRMLDHPYQFLAIPLTLAITLFFARWLVRKKAESIPNLLFEEANSPEICELMLRGE